jgi:hypothetical protein
MAELISAKLVLRAASSGFFGVCLLIEAAVGAEDAIGSVMMVKRKRRKKNSRQASAQRTCISRLPTPNFEKTPRSGDWSTLYLSSGVFSFLRSHPVATDFPRANHYR